MSKKTVKLAKAQRPSGASTSAEHPKPQAQKSKGPSKGTLIGASLLALGAGLLITLTRNSWPIKAAQRAATGEGAQGSGTRGIDPDLNAEVASATTSNPQTEGNFTDEGATGNND
jgi:hypothetical protein